MYEGTRKISPRSTSRPDFHRSGNNPADEVESLRESARKQLPTNRYGCLGIHIISISTSYIHTYIHTYTHMHTYSKYRYTCILVRISKFMHSEKFPLWKTGRSLHPLLHYAFGDSSLRELPHITAPLWSFVDRLVVFITNHS